MNVILTYNSVCLCNSEVNITGDEYITPMMGNSAMENVVPKCPPVFVHF